MNIHVHTCRLGHIIFLTFGNGLKNCDTPPKPISDINECLIRIEEFDDFTAVLMSF